MGSSENVDLETRASGDTNTKTNHCHNNGSRRTQSLYTTISNFKSPKKTLNVHLCPVRCDWEKDHCWPGDCDGNFASRCQCRDGFSRTGDIDTGRRCQCKYWLKCTCARHLSTKGEITFYYKGTISSRGLGTSTFLEKRL